MQRNAREQLQVEDDGSYGEITTVPLHKGPATSLDPELEQKIRLFIEECYNMGMPRCKGKLSLDIQEYLKRNDIDVSNFEDQIPGKLLNFLTTFQFNY